MAPGSAAPAKILGLDGAEPEKHVSDALRKLWLEHQKQLIRCLPAADRSHHVLDRLRRLINKLL